ncbi:phytanoyl-CoA dioxygenase family protein [Longispora albida]|uniref:phytanoyl-CoA dioxygenase family protein n=1 Tax=Longispora albida TaxID=203523 RepID=UPI00146B5C3E|nr:phytanoyl-CoA dioxygenase family protein [Longispora albida]
MNFDDAARTWLDQGFVVLPGLIPAEELQPALSELGLMFPSAEGFHDETDPRRERFLADEFDGIDAFPFASTELSLLAVHPRLIALAGALLGDDDVHIHTAEAWAKYTGACEYDQDMHRDYLNYTLAVPSSAPEYRQLEMFVYLADVTVELGAPRLVPRSVTEGMPAVPNWHLRPGLDGEGRFLDTSGSPHLYEAEVAATGPAGTVVAFEAGTFHRGTALTAPRGARYSMHLGYQRDGIRWGQRRGWASCSYEDNWTSFVERATPRQLQAFGFPPPGHPYWTPETLAGTALRYPGLDLTPWRNAS